jgi:hypothetical protein
MFAVEIPVGGVIAFGWLRWHRKQSVPFIADAELAQLDPAVPLGNGVPA